MPDRRFRTAFPSCTRRRDYRRSGGAGEQIAVSQIPLKPLHPMREIRGPLNALLAPEIAAQGDSEDYLHVTLTDEQEPENANSRLRAVYPNLMKLDFDNSRTRQEGLLLCPGRLWNSRPWRRCLRILPAAEQ